MSSLFDIFIISMVTYALSSAWLFSPGFIGNIREMWIEYWSNRDSSFQYLGICQLCSGFWIGLFSTIFYLSLYEINFNNIVIAITNALISSVFSWTFGSITNAFLWHKAMVEQECEYNRKYRNV